jgi:hypothetical protein
MVARATFPDLWTYFNLVAGYNHRHLTYPSDVQEAFSAVLDVMSSGSPGGFHFGIPEFCFDIGLLWASSKKWPLTRRTMFPSWSWMGWAGPVELLWDFRQAAWDIEWKEVGWRVVHSPVWVEPTTSWKKVAHDGEPTRISNDYSFYRDYTQQSFGYYKKPGLRLPTTSKPLPAGWTYEDRGAWEKGYITESIPKKLFNFPFPIAESKSSPEVDKWTTHLHFRTRFCRLRVRVSGSPRRAIGARLENAKGEWVGVVQFDAGALSDKFCSFIEMSKVSAFGQLKWMEQYEDPFQEWNFFYNVSLIE